MNFLNLWHVMPKHHYYKHIEYKKTYSLNGRLYTFYVSTIDGENYDLILNDYIFKNVSIKTIEDWLNVKGYNGNWY